MNVRADIVVLVLTAGLSAAASAYEQATHALVTKYAFESSPLAPEAGNLPPLVRSLGLDTWSPLGAGYDYFEMSTQFSNGIPIAHIAQAYEREIVKYLGANPDIDPIRAWLMYGAIREDDNKTEDPPTPQDVAPGLRRPLSHFYDPYNNLKLNSPALADLAREINKAPDWAMGSPDAFEQPNTPQTPRDNTFTVFDAREAMLRALTLETYDGSGYVDVAGASTPAERQRFRRMYWATVFRALGDVLHLNQDMAQPQHTRNEPHAGKYCSWIPRCPGGHSSVYEKYMKARALGTTAFDLDQPYNKPVTIWPLAIPAGSYPIPAFASYADYWSTGKGPASLVGKGLANYSNQGFFTAGKNLDSTEYPSPPHHLDAFTVRTMPARRWDGTVTTNPAPTYVLFGSVTDSWQGSVASNVPLTTFGLWDEFLEKRGALPRYTLNRFNYDAMADLLIPRAVAYSAGLINYFFRGVLEVTRPDEGVFALADHADPTGFTRIRAKLRNATPDFAAKNGSTQVQSMTSGDLIAVIKYHRDLKYSPSLDGVVGVAPCDEPLTVVIEQNPDATTHCRDGVEQIIVSPPIRGVSIGNGSEQLVEFDFSATPIPFGVTDVVLQVVYRGTLGGETHAIAVGSVDLSEPTYFTYHNATDYIRIADRVYTRPEVEQDLNLISQIQPRSCVDEGVSPPVLRPDCAQPVSLDLAVMFDEQLEPLAMATDLRHRRFVRFAYLTVADESASPPAEAARFARLKLVSQVHGSPTAGLPQQDSTCMPRDPVEAKARLMQVRHITWQQYALPISRMARLRGVNGWTTTSCVLNGSDAASETPDDRKAKMAPLKRDSDEFKPFPVTIMPKYLAGQP
ncbi:MAG: hypothetical protein JSS46_13305 [Proteobacteria bacterium]|jgi:hypothetical protein|nr:hypothetical protein [Pseudomonadota bacterium]